MGITMSAEALHPIRAVAMRTGISTHVIRAWEKRYNAVSPRRTGTNRRLYSNEDIERLQLLKMATDAGRGISHVAGLKDAELRKLVAADGVPPANLDSERLGQGDTPSGHHLEKCLASIRALDVRGLETALLQATVTLAPQKLVEEVVVPLMIRVGDMWQQGTIRPAHEHLASSVIRTLLGNMTNAYDTPAGAPDLLVATPAGQVHEFGALAAAVTAASEGWRVSYLGPNLPAEDIAAAAVHRKARAVALSMVYPSDDAQLHGELLRLRRLLPGDTKIVVGGRSAIAYDSTLAEISAGRVGDLAELREMLRAIRIQGQGTADAVPS